MNSRCEPRSARDARGSPRRCWSKAPCCSIAGGACGVVLAFGLLRVLLAFAPPDTPRIDEVHLDAVALLFAVAAASACGILFGALPAAQAWRRWAATKACFESAAPAARPARTVCAAGLLVAEVALALILLDRRRVDDAHAARPTAIDPGFPRRSPDHDARLDVRRRVDRARGAPVSSTNWWRARRHCPAWSTPRSSRRCRLTARAGTPSSRRRTSRFRRADQLPAAAITPATPGYFEAMGTRLLRGRASPRPTATAVAWLIVVNDTLARRIWPGEDAVGKRIKRGFPDQPGEWREVVGVVQDVKVDGLALQATRRSTCRTRR